MKIRSLGGNNFIAYSKAFLNNEITGADLADLDTKDLIDDLSIKKLADRKTVLSALTKLLSNGLKPEKQSKPETESELIGVLDPEYANLIQSDGKEEYARMADQKQKRYDVMKDTKRQLRQGQISRVEREAERDREHDRLVNNAQMVHDMIRSYNDAVTHDTIIGAKKAELHLVQQATDDAAEETRGFQAARLKVEKNKKVMQKLLDRRSL